MRIDKIKKKHHHDPRKFKFGILKYSIASKIVIPEYNDSENLQDSIQLKEENLSGRETENK